MLVIFLKETLVCKYSHIKILKQIYWTWSHCLHCLIPAYNPVQNQCACNKTYSCSKLVCLHLFLLNVGKLFTCDNGTDPVFSSKLKAEQHWKLLKAAAKGCSFLCKFCSVQFLDPMAHKKDMRGNSAHIFFKSFFAGGHCDQLPAWTGTLFDAVHPLFPLLSIENDHPTI